MTPYLLITVITNEDGSGSIEEKDWVNGQYVLDFRAEWDASGHGQWKEDLDLSSNVPQQVYYWKLLFRFRAASITLNHKAQPEDWR